MIVRTYGRRSRDDAVSDHHDPFSFSSEENNSTTTTRNNNTTTSSQDFYSSFPFSSQESPSSLWSSFDEPDLDPYNDLVTRKAKKKRNGAKIESKSLVPLTSTLMEAQEFGEMMEHVDEVNFALDGLRKCQPVRIRRASLLSLLSICGTPQQRRLLRTHGLVKTIIDSILDLKLDDSASNLAAVSLLYALTCEGQDDYPLESSKCVRFLIKLMKPVASDASKGKGPNIGSKLLALCKDSDTLRDTGKLVDSSSASISAKVEEILVSCKELKPRPENKHGTERPELNPKWTSLLAIEKACLSKISFDDVTGAVRKTGGDFKEKLREFGGLGAVFEVIMNCYSVMEKWKESGAPSSQSANYELELQTLAILLKCLKIMENSTFLSYENQSHLLGMKGPFDAQGRRLSFTRIIISVIKILSSLSLLKNPPSTSNNANNPQNRNEHALALIANHNVDANEVICISSSTSFSNTERTSSKKSCSLSQKSSASTSETTATGRIDISQLRLRPLPSTSSSCSESLRSNNCRVPVVDNGSKTSSALIDKPDNEIDELCEILGGSRDPYAFDEVDCQPSKWDLLYGKSKKSQSKNNGTTSRKTSNKLEDDRQDRVMSQEDSCNGAMCQLGSSNLEHEDSQNTSDECTDEDYSNLLADCLLTAIKVLMNLTNENSVGCQQIAACEGLETMSSLIADHFPSFSLSPSFINETKDDKATVEIDYRQDDRLTDQELDFLVAILGLLVNLVEKDGHNRSRLATASVPLHCPKGLETSSHRDVIPLLCSIFLANQGAGDASGHGNVISWNDESAMLQGEKEAEKMIVEAYAALLLAFLSTESKSIRSLITDCLPNHNLAILVPVLEQFVEFHLTLNMISPETHKAVNEVIESCRKP